MIAFEEWAAINQAEARRRARDPEMKPLRYRIEYAAMGWANLIGHAEFAPGALAVILQSHNPQTGALSIPSMSAVSNAIREAKDAGLVAAQSTAQCLVAPSEWLAKKGGHGGTSCRVHGIRARRRRT